MGKTYECVYILNPDSSEEQVEKIVSQASQIITEEKGNIEGVLGVEGSNKRLQYIPAKLDDGVLKYDKENAVFVGKLDEKGNPVKG